MKNDFNWEERFMQTGLKRTKQRIAILKILQESQQPVAAETIYLKLKGEGNPVNLSTVYRALDTMAEKKLILKLSIVGEGRKLFEINRKIHKHYLVCLRCKRIIPIEHCPLEEYEKKLEKETRYLIAGHKLDIYGYCPECQSHIDS